MDRMLSEMTASEIAEWEVAASLGAFDSPRSADLRAGVVAAEIANMAGMKITGERRKPADYFRDPLADEEAAPEPDELSAKILALFQPMAEASNGK